MVIESGAKKTKLTCQNGNWIPNKAFECRGPCRSPDNSYIRLILIFISSSFTSFACCYIALNRVVLSMILYCRVVLLSTTR